LTRDSDAAPDRGVDSAWACDADLIDIATDVLEVEAAAIIGLKASVDTSFVNAVRRILDTRGRVIVSGMGKSGIIANKIAATLASTGTPAFFMHPAEALHGDLGMVTPADIFVAISNSGETDELVKLLPYLRDNRNLVVGMTGNPHSTLATHSGIHLSTRVEREACPLQLAPTASTTATLAMGDALAVALMRVRGFEAHHFARFHPGGSLGRRLLKRVRDEMRSDSLPFVGISDDADTVLGVINECRLGVALVCDEDRRALGIITDGDLRRALRAHGRDFFNLLASNLMTPHPVTISIDSTMNAAFDLMAEHAITLVVVLDGLQVAGVVQK
jgi:arabinose-5-phosphate isomerase